jgi:hypothetical protein
LGVGERCERVHYTQRQPPSETPDIFDGTCEPKKMNEKK